MNYVALRLEFSTDRFALTGELPSTANAGNQFFGEDVAKHLCQVLAAWKLDYLDEDWGWLVASTRDALPVAERHSIGVYAYPDENQSNNFGQWMLMLETEHQVPWLKAFTRWRKKRFDPNLAQALVEAVSQLSVQELKVTEIEFDNSGNEKREVPYSA